MIENLKPNKSREPGEEKRKKKKESDDSDENARKFRLSLKHELLNTDCGLFNRVPGIKKEKH